MIATEQTVNGRVHGLLLEIRNARETARGRAGRNPLMPELESWADRLAGIEAQLPNIAVRPGRDGDDEVTEIYADTDRHLPEVWVRRYFEGGVIKFRVLNADYAVHEVRQHGEEGGLTVHVVPRAS